MNTEQDQREVLIQGIATLKQDHRDLDLAISALADQLNVNQMEITRLKRQKLKLKDAISRLESDLIPNLLA